MFEVGTRCNFKTIERDGYVRWNATVETIDGPLLKFSDNGEEWIFNAHCPRYEQASINEATSIDQSDFTAGLVGGGGELREYSPGKD